MDAETRRRLQAALHHVEMAGVASRDLTTARIHILAVLAALPVEPEYGGGLAMDAETRRRLMNLVAQWRNQTAQSSLEIRGCFNVCADELFAVLAALPAEPPSSEYRAGVDAVRWIRGAALPAEPPPGEMPQVFTGDEVVLDGFGSRFIPDATTAAAVQGSDGIQAINRVVTIWRRP